MRVAMAQVDCRLGDVGGNLKQAEERITQAAELGADLVVFPELALHGYALGRLGADTSLDPADARMASLICNDAWQPMIP